MMLTIAKHQVPITIGFSNRVPVITGLLEKSQQQLDFKNRVPVTTGL